MDGPHPTPAGAPDSRPAFSGLTLDRRRFLVLLGGAAACTALPPSLAWAEKLVRTSQLQSWTLPQSLPAGPLEVARGLIGAAILAPSYWNTQPWRFEVEGEAIRLVLEPSRTLSGSDPDQRYAHLSLGAALENLLVAARAWGLHPSVRYLPWGLASRPGAPLVAAEVSWAQGEAGRDHAMFAAIPARRSNPRPFDGRAITLQSRAALQAQLPDEVHLHWLEDRKDIRDVARRVQEAVFSRTQVAGARADWFRWLRRSDADARRAGTGMTAERLGLSGPLGSLAARSLRPGSRLHRWGAGSLAHETQERVQSSGALALLTAPRRSEALFLLAGQAYERLALKATSLGIAHQPLSSPLETESDRARMAKRFGAAGEEALLLVRFGHAGTPEPTPRHAVALVSTGATPDRARPALASASGPAGRLQRSPLTVISEISSVGQAVEVRKCRSFPTAVMAASISSECPATVMPSTGCTRSPFSIQNPCAW